MQILKCFTLFQVLSKSSLLITSVVLMSGLFSYSAFAENENTWHARLSPNPVSFGTRTTITGLGEASADLNNNTLTIRGTFYGLQGKATAVKIHHGAKAIPGPAIVDINLQLEGDGKQGAMTGEVVLNEEQRQALFNESLYIQIYSEAAKEGNLRGWLLPVVSNAKNK